MELGKLLQDEGRILVEVPTWYSIERAAPWLAWIDLRPEQHLWHFSLRTLRRVPAAGYRDVQIATLGEPLPSRGSIVASVGIVRRAQVGAASHKQDNSATLARCRTFGNNLHPPVDGCRGRRCGQGSQRIEAEPQACGCRPNVATQCA